MSYIHTSLHQRENKLAKAKELLLLEERRLISRWCVVNVMHVTQSDCILSFDVKTLGKGCVWMGYTQSFDSPKASRKSYLSHDTSILFGMESGLRTFFIVSPDNTDGTCEYIILSNWSNKRDPPKRLMHVYICRENIWKWSSWIVMHESKSKK